jgi:hypothetical protein
MTTGSILIALGIAVIVAAYLVRPLVSHQVPRRAGGDLTALVNQKESLLDEIKQLEFDHDTGQVPTEAYGPMREKLLRDAAELLRELDARGVVTVDVVAGDTDRQIEAAIARRRAVADPAAAPKMAPAPAAAAVSVAAPTPAPVLAGETPARQANFCPQCGAAIVPGDRFCAGCGHQL